MQTLKKWHFESYQKRFRDFEILPKFSETHVFRGTIRHPFYKKNISNIRDKSDWGEESCSEESSLEENIEEDNTVHLWTTNSQLLGVFYSGRKGVNELAGSR